MTCPEGPQQSGGGGGGHAKRLRLQRRVCRIQSALAMKTSVERDRKGGCIQKPLPPPPSESGGGTENPRVYTPGPCAGAGTHRPRGSRRVFPLGGGDAEGEALGAGSPRGPRGRGCVPVPFGGALVNVLRWPGGESGNALQPRPRARPPGGPQAHTHTHTHTHTHQHTAHLHRSVGLHGLATARRLGVHVHVHVVEVREAVGFAGVRSAVPFAGGPAAEARRRGLQDGPEDLLQERAGLGGAPQGPPRGGLGGGPRAALGGGPRRLVPCELVGQQPRGQQGPLHECCAEGGMGGVRGARGTGGPAPAHRRKSLINGCVIPQRRPQRPRGWTRDPPSAPRSATVQQPSALPCPVHRGFFCSQLRSRALATSRRPMLTCVLETSRMTKTKLRNRTHFVSRQPLNATETVCDSHTPSTHTPVQNTPLPCHQSRLGACTLCLFQDTFG